VSERRRMMLENVRKNTPREACQGALVVGLLPARTDTKWFHDFIYHKAQIRFLRGRLKFSGAIYSAPFPSMIVIWEPEKE